MALMMYESVEPLSSDEIQKIDPKRADDVERKHRLVSEFLENHSYDALLLQAPSNFAWFTSGADSSRGGSSETTAALFITRDARVVVCSNVDSALLFERELPGLGFQLKERPWHEPRHVLLDDLCRGRTVASDSGFGQTHDVSVSLSGMRLPLSNFECERLRHLGRTVAHAVEATARNLKRYQSEAEVAGELAHRLIKHRVVPERVQVLADRQGLRYRHSSYGDQRIKQFCGLSAIGRQGGLCAGAARMVCFGEPADDLKTAHQKALLVQATGIYFSKAEWELFEIWNRIQRIYEKFDCLNEWRIADQASIVGYQPCEVPLVPKSEFRLAGAMPMYWYPSVGPTVTGDTLLVTEEGSELLTPAPHWPKVQIVVKGTTIDRPGILQREL